MKILTTDNKKNERFLRKKVPVLDLKKENKKELSALVKEMRILMKMARGIGLSANQVGVSKRLFVTEVPSENEKTKFYVFFNPVFTKISKETSLMEEGCLSIPGVFGPVLRSEKVTIEGTNIQGKKLKIRAWGLLARVFQHEMDHLNGVLFIDKAKSIYQAGER